MVAVPTNLGTLEDIKRRESQAFKNNDKWQDILDDVYEYFLPNRNLFNREDKGQKKMDKIFDSTSLEAIQSGASKLQANIAPIWATWANFEPSPQILKLLAQGDFGVSEADIRENLEEQAEIVFDVINRSNFATQFFEMSLDLLIGTGSMMIDEDEDDDMPVIFNTMPQVGIAFEEGPQGNVETHWRRFTVKARNLERKWPGFEMSAELVAKVKNSPDVEVGVSEGVVFDPKDKNYWAVVWITKEDKLSWVADFQDSSAWVTGRYAKTAGEIRGRGPAIQVLPDVKSLNKAKEFVLQKAAIDLAGMWTATDDGSINPYTVTIAPGITIPVATNDVRNPSIARLDTGQNLALAQFEILELQTAIKLAFFADLREPSDAVVSATQFAIEARDLAKRIGSAYGRLQTEVLVPVLKRVVWILKRRGLIQPINIGGTEVTIKFTSPLARAQDAEDLLSVQQAVAFTMETAGPDQAKMAFKLEDFGTWAAEKTGMPQELVRNESEKKVVIDAGAAAAREGLVGPAQPQPQLRAV